MLWFKTNESLRGCCFDDLDVKPFSLPLRLINNSTLTAYSPFVAILTLCLFTLHPPSITSSLTFHATKYFFPLLTQIQSSTLQPPPTSEHLQRVTSMMETLQTSAKTCSPSPTNNILYPSHTRTHKYTHWAIHTELHRTGTGLHTYILPSSHYHSYSAHH